jgi:hypothetical protein
LKHYNQVKLMLLILEAAYPHTNEDNITSLNVYSRQREWRDIHNFSFIFFRNITHTSP